MVVAAGKTYWGGPAVRASSSQAIHSSQRGKTHARLAQFGTSAGETNDDEDAATAVLRALGLGRLCFAGLASQPGRGCPFERDPWYGRIPILASQKLNIWVLPGAAGSGVVSLCASLSQLPFSVLCFLRGKLCQGRRQRHMFVCFCASFVFRCRLLFRFAVP